MLRNGSTIAATPIDATEWNQVALVNLPSGDISVYLNGHQMTAFSYTPPPTPTTISLLMHAGAAYDDVAVYGSDTADGWDELTVLDYMTAARAGVHNWTEDRPGASSWASVAERVSASLSNVLATQASIGGAARTAELKTQIQQRMVDAIDSATARLVNKDIDRLGALRAAGEVREQLAQAMMQSQTATLSAQTSLFSSALGFFDAMNIGGFRPMGLETAGARAVL